MFRRHCAVNSKATEWVEGQNQSLEDITAVLSREVAELKIRPGNGLGIRPPLQGLSRNFRSTCADGNILPKSPLEIR
jgi:hypothetical protein